MLINDITASTIRQVDMRVVIKHIDNTNNKNNLKIFIILAETLYITDKLKDLFLLLVLISESSKIFIRYFPLIQESFRIEKNLSSHLFLLLFSSK